MKTNWDIVTHIPLPFFCVGLYSLFCIYVQQRPPQQSTKQSIVHSKIRIYQHCIYIHPPTSQAMVFLFISAIPLNNITTTTTAKSPQPHKQTQQPTPPPSQPILQQQ